MVIGGGQQVGSKVLYPLLLFDTTAIGAVPVTTTMVLVMQVLAATIVAPVHMATIACCVAGMQLTEHRFAHYIKWPAGCLSKQVL